MEAALADSTAAAGTQMAEDIQIKTSRNGYYCKAQPC